jgi:hypothetical protein
VLQTAESFVLICFSMDLPTALAARPERGEVETLLQSYASAERLEALGRFLAGDVLPRLDAPCRGCAAAEARLSALEALVGAQARLLRDLSGDLHALRRRVGPGGHGGEDDAADPPSAPLSPSTTAPCAHSPPRAESEPERRCLRLLWKRRRLCSKSGCLLWDAAMGGTTGPRAPIEWPAPPWRPRDGGGVSVGDELPAPPPARPSPATICVSQSGLYRVALALFAPIGPTASDGGAPPCLPALTLLLDGAPVLTVRQQRRAPPPPLAACRHAGGGGHVSAAEGYNDRTGAASVHKNACAVAESPAPAATTTDAVAANACVLHWHPYGAVMAESSGGGGQYLALPSGAALSVALTCGSGCGSSSGGHGGPCCRAAFGLMGASAAAVAVPAAAAAAAAADASDLAPEPSSVLLLASFRGQAFLELAKL